MTEEFPFLERRKQGVICRNPLVLALAAGSPTALTVDKTVPNCAAADKVFALEVKRLMRHARKMGFDGVDSLMAAPESVRRKLIEVMEPDTANINESQIDTLFKMSAASD